MIRSVASIPLLVLTAGLLAPVLPARSAPPIPVDPTPEVLAAGEACPFPIELVAQGQSKLIFIFKNPRYYVIAPAPQQQLTVTNLANDKSVSVNVTGTWRISPLPEAAGDLAVVRAGGQNFIYGNPEIGATALVTTGPIEMRFATGGELAEMDISGARVRDLCAELD